MLYSLIITISNNGTVVFEKEWVKLIAGKTIRFGGLLTTMQTLAKQGINMTVSYLEFEEIALSVVQNQKSGLSCALFHEKEDGPEFGKIIAGAILSSFLREFPDETWNGINIRPQKFTGFTNKIVDAINNSTQTILQQLKQKRGLLNALLVFDEGRHPITAGKLEDHVAVVANLQALLTFSSELMAAKQDAPQVVTLDMSKQVVYLYRLRANASLVCICRKSVRREAYLEHIHLAATLVEQVFTLQRNLTGQ
ncbi:Saccharopine dehydrogenase [Balamuthia mandrillaris]